MSEWNTMKMKKDKMSLEEYYLNGRFIELTFYKYKDKSHEKTIKSLSRLFSFNSLKELIDDYVSGWSKFEKTYKPLSYHMFVVNNFWFILLGLCYLILLLIHGQINN